MGPEPRHRRGPGHLPHCHQPAGRPEGEGGQGRIGLRVLLRLRDLRGRHRYLLGPQPGPGIPLEDHRQPSAGREDGTGAGCHLGGLGLPVRPGGPFGPAQHGRAPVLPGLVPPVLAQERSRRRGGGHRGWPGPPVPGERGSEQARRLPHSHRRGHPGREVLQFRGRRPARRVQRPRVHGSGAGLRQEHEGPGERRSQGL